MWTYPPPPPHPQPPSPTLPPSTHPSSVHLSIGLLFDCGSFCLLVRFNCELPRRRAHGLATVIASDASGSFGPSQSVPAGSDRRLCAHAPSLALRSSASLQQRLLSPRPGRILFGPGGGRFPSIDDIRRCSTRKLPLRMTGIRMPGAAVIAQLPSQRRTEETCGWSIG